MIKLAESKFVQIPEGVQVLKITEVDYNAKFGNMKVTMVNDGGIKHVETFRFVTSSGKTNQGGINVFSYFARTAFNNYKLQEINEEELVGCFIKVNVTYDIQPNKNDPSKTVTFVRLGKFQPALGFDGKDDLDDLL